MNNLIDTFKDNVDKLSNIHIEMACLNNTYVIEYYYKSRNNLIGVEYFSYDEFNNDILMKSIINMYNRYVSNIISMRNKVINY